jgi:hypothetical protein
MISPGRPTDILPLGNGWLISNSDSTGLVKAVTTLPGRGRIRQSKSGLQKRWHSIRIKIVIDYVTLCKRSNRICSYPSTFNGMKNRTISRRSFLTRAAGMASAPLILPGSIFGKNGAVAPSNKIIVGAIGIGGRMTRADLPSFLAQPDVQLVAVADCFAERRQTGKEMVDGHYGNKDCAIYRYHEEILERSDIDAVIIATGDRWHAPLSAAAARAGKDVYTEKPFCLTIMEGRRLVNLMNRLGTVWQCGTQRRSVDTYAFIVDVIHRGLIGHLEKMTAFLGPRFSRNLIPIPEEQPLPDENNFD